MKRTIFFFLLGISLVSFAEEPGHGEHQHGEHQGEKPELRMIVCEGTGAKLRFLPTNQDGKAELYARYLDYEVTSFDDEIQVHTGILGKTLSVRLPQDKDGTVEHIVWVVSPNVLNGPTSSEIFLSPLLISRRYLYQDAVPTYTESVSMRCEDSEPWKKKMSHQGIVKHIAHDEILIEDAEGKSTKFYLIKEVVVIKNGEVSSIAKVELGSSVRLVSRSDGKITTIFLSSN